MPLQDILNAISAQSDKRIADARAEHKRATMQMREESEKRLATFKQELSQQKEAKKQQLRARAESAALSRKRNALLRTKRELLDRLYGEVAANIASLPDEDIEPFLRSCMARLPGAGTIRPAKRHEGLLQKLAHDPARTFGDPIDAAGGFLFVSDTADMDFTIENLVEGMLRPRTEPEAARALFSVSSGA